MPIPEGFSRTIERANAFVAMHRRAHGKRGRPVGEWGDVLRGALVLGVGALDATVLEIVVEAIPLQAARSGLGRDVENWVQKDPEAVLGCFAGRNPRTMLGRFARDQLTTMTFQRAAAIEGVLYGTIKCPSPWDEVASAMTTQRDAWDRERVVATLDEYVLRRHRIAHDGDFDPESGRARPIRRQWVEDGLFFIEVVVGSVAVVVDEHLGR